MDSLSHFLGTPVYTTRRVPIDQILSLRSPTGGYELQMHPYTLLRICHPNSPVLSSRTAGHREMFRDQRKFRRR